MSKMKKSVVLWLILSLVVMVFTVSCSNEKQVQQKVRVLRLGHAMAPSHPLNVAVVEFAKAVEKETQGAIKVEVKDSGVLGGERDMFEQVRMGALDIALLGTGAGMSLEPKLQIEELPYAFQTHEQAYAAMDGEVGQKLADILAKKNLKVLGFYENGYRQMTNRVRPINKPEDMTGLKIRSAELEMRLDMFRLLGASPIPMAFTELFTALQQGTVDGQENPLAIIENSKFYEVQKYLSLTNHIWCSFIMVMNQDLFNSLSPEQQTVIKRNAEKYRDMERELIRKGEEGTLKNLKEKGMEINKVDIKPFRQAVNPIYEKYKTVFGEDLMRSMQKYMKD